VAKEVRSSTEIGDTASRWPPLPCAWPASCLKTSKIRILFVGAGEMIELVHPLCGPQPQQITIANRTLERGEKLACSSAPA
jgi:glutamyl-tRNA reductase